MRHLGHEEPCCEGTCLFQWLSDRGQSTGFGRRSVVKSHDGNVLWNSQSELTRGLQCSDGQVVEVRHDDGRSVRARKEETSGCLGLCDVSSRRGDRDVYVATPGERLTEPIEAAPGL